MSTINGEKIITLEEVKNFLRVTSDLDDQLIITLIQSALEQIEGYIGQNLLEDIYSEELQNQEIISPKYQPCLEVLSVKEGDKNLNYLIENDQIILLDRPKGKIKIDYRAGLFKEKFIPSSIKHLLLQLVQAFYQDPKANSLTILKNFNLFKKYKL
jgi:hypothetical protein